MNGLWRGRRVLITGHTGFKGSWLGTWLHQLGDDGQHPHEDLSLQLDSSRARAVLGWQPQLTLPTALEWTVRWYLAFGASEGEALELMLDQIRTYEGLLAGSGLVLAS